VFQVDLELVGLSFIDIFILVSLLQMSVLVAHLFLSVRLDFFTSRSQNCNEKPNEMTKRLSEMQCQRLIATS